MDMENNRANNVREAETLAELELLKQIRNIYEDVETTVTFKRTERERATKAFIEECIKTLSLSKEEIKNAVDTVIKRAKWIKGIEEL